MSFATPQLVPYFPPAAPPEAPAVACFELSSSVAASVLQALSGVDSSPEDDVESFEHESACALRRVLPTSCLDVVASLRARERSTSALLIQGLPVDAALPSTPGRSAKPSRRSSHVNEACLLGFGRLLGRAYAFRSEKAGAIVHNVFPVAGREAELSNEGSLAPFRFHTEVAAHPASPDYILLSCLRADCDQLAETLVADVARACAKLGSGELVDLQRDEFELLAPRSFRGSRQVLVCRVLRRVGQSFEARLNLNGMRALTERAHAALSHFSEVLSDHAVVSAVRLTPGDLLLIDNRRTVHGRSGFRPRYDGGDRWLQRIYVRRELWATTSDLVYPNRVVE